MAKNNDFVHLHVHSDNSQLDGCGKISDYAFKAKEYGHNAIAMTDHGTMRSYHKQLKECEKNDIKPIYGIEFYVCDDMHRKGLTNDEKSDAVGNLVGAAKKKAIKEKEESEGVRKRTHLTVWAKNKEGIKNLFELSSKAWIDGYYYRPRIDLDTLIQHSDGLIVATGCAGSVINKTAIEGRLKRSMQDFERLSNTFGEDLWLEVMPHSFDEQTTANKLALDLYSEYNGKHRLLATQDAHYVEPGDWEAHECMLCIGTNNNLSNPDRFKFGDGELYLKTRRQMYDSFIAHHKYIGEKLIEQSLDNTIELASGIDNGIIEIDPLKCIMPPIDIPKKYKGNDFAYIKSLCIGGWSWREIPKRAELYAIKNGITTQQSLTIYKQRLKYELDCLRKQKFVGYMLLIRDLYKFARSKEIMCGPGRGSSSGALTSFLLGITSVDPIEHGLMFERFINPDRHEMPDVDCDFEDIRRQEILEYLRQKYGADKTSQIATISSLSGKQCVKDVSRVLEVPYKDANNVTNHILERSASDPRANNTIEDSFSEVKECVEFNKKYPDVLKYCKVLEGMNKNLGIHAAGVVTSPVSLSSIIPLEVRKYNGTNIVVTAVDKIGVEDAGLLKLDILGLKYLSIVSSVLNAIEKRHNKKINMEELGLEDEKTLEGFTKNDTVGIFQFDSDSANRLCKNIVFDRFEDITAMNALNRPGATRSGIAEQYIDKKTGKKKLEHPIHPLVTKICSDSLGFMIYQEQVQRIFVEIAGFQKGKAETLRKLIAKSKGADAIERVRDDFVKGSVEFSSLTEDEASHIMDLIVHAGGYLFNKSHSTAYSVISYWCMYLKTYYPLEFYYGLLKSETSRDRIKDFASDARKHNIELLPPDVLYSESEFSIDYENNAIRSSLVDIKSVGEIACKSIVETRPFDGFVDFLEKVDRRKVNKRVVESLIKSGAMDVLLPNVKWFVENFEDLWVTLNSKNGLEDARKVIESIKTENDYDDNERQLIASQVNPMAFIENPVKIYEDFVKKQLDITTHSIAEKDFWDKYTGEAIYFPCVFNDFKINKIGDFHKGEQPSDKEKERMFWGCEYATVFIEDSTGNKSKIKFDIDIYLEFASMIENSVGDPLLVHCVPNKQYDNFRAHFAINLKELKNKLNNNEELNVWEKIVVGKHPSKTYNWKASKTKTEKQVRKSRVENKAFFKRRSKLFTGIVKQTHIKYDRNSRKMAFFSMIDGAQNTIDCICFSSFWKKDVEKIIKSGSMLKVELNGDKNPRTKKDQYFFNGGKIVYYKV